MPLPNGAAKATIAAEAPRQQSCGMGPLPRVATRALAHRAGPISLPSQGRKRAYVHSPGGYRRMGRSTSISPRRYLGEGSTGLARECGDQEPWRKPAFPVSACSDLAIQPKTGNTTHRRANATTVGYTGCGTHGDKRRETGEGCCCWQLKGRHERRGSEWHAGLAGGLTVSKARMKIEPTVSNRNRR